MTPRLTRTRQGRRLAPSTEVSSRLARQERLEVLSTVANLRLELPIHPHKISSRSHFVGSFTHLHPPVDFSCDNFINTHGNGLPLKP